MEWKNTVPEWQNEGTEPSEDRKSKGFEAGYKPPAGIFNWFWSKVTKCIKEIQEKINKVDNKMKRIVVATSTDGVAYTATVEEVSELYNGLEITIIPDKRSTAKAITLNVNGLGAVPVRQPLSFSTFVATAPDREAFMYEDTPCRLMYHANYITGGIWLMADKQKTSAQDLYGQVPVDGGGTGATTAAQARTNLGIKDFSNVTLTKNTAKKLTEAGFYTGYVAHGVYGTSLGVFYWQPMDAMVFPFGQYQLAYNAFLQEYYYVSNEGDLIALTDEADDCTFYIAKLS